jgi:hypothetical protein
MKLFKPAQRFFALTSFEKSMALGTYFIAAKVQHPSCGGRRQAPGSVPIAGILRSSQHFLTKFQIHHAASS